MGDLKGAEQTWPGDRVDGHGPHGHGTCSCTRTGRPQHRHDHRTKGPTERRPQDLAQGNRSAAHLGQKGP